MNPLPLEGAVALEQRVEELESKLATVIWLHAELAHGLRLAVAAQMIQQLQPHLKQALVDRIVSGRST